MLLIDIMEGMERNAALPSAFLASCLRCVMAVIALSLPPPEIMSKTGNKYIRSLHKAKMQKLLWLLKELCYEAKNWCV